MKRLSAFLALAALASPAAAWGPIGHRIAAQIAQDNVSGQTRARIEQILGDEELPEASTWPDEQRSNPAPFWQTESAPWHFVTLPLDTRIEDLPHPPEGDAQTALAHYTEVLRAGTAGPQDMQLALRFVVHIVADMHTPLHVGQPGDRGGNWVNVLWFDEPQNLHWVWDEGMIGRQQLSYTEYTERLENRMTPEQVIEWWNTDPVTWMGESAEIRMRLYPPPGPNGEDGSREKPIPLRYEYGYQWVPTMELRLQKAGIRTAAYLDWVFAGK